MALNYRSKVGLYILVLFYAFAGLNHFIMPDFYIALIPEEFQPKSLFNTLAGLVEIMAAIGLFFDRSRKLAVYVTILMLVAFLPAHIYLIELGGCVPEGLCVPLWVAWFRLIVIHPILIFWAWKYRNFKKNELANR